MSQPVSSASLQLIPLQDSWTALIMQGPDSAKFMQGQLTCNTATQTETQARFGGHCTPKGRLVANFYLTKTAADSFLFFVPQGCAAQLLKSLSKYIVFSKAKLRDAATEVTRFGVSGEQAFAALQQQLPELRNERLASASNETLYALCVEPNRFLVAVACEQADGWSQQLMAQGAITANSDAWLAADIQAGFGFVAAETIEEFIPQMLNMQLIDGVSFNKGCYTGQEIVARMQYRGTLKKAMYLVTGTGSAPAANSEIFQAERMVGNIVNSVTSAEGWQALAVINIDASEQDLTIDSQAIAVNSEQPYRLNSPEA